MAKASWAGKSAARPCQMRAASVMLALIAVGSIMVLAAATESVLLKGLTHAGVSGTWNGAGGGAVWLLAGPCGSRTGGSHC